MSEISHGVFCVHAPRVGGRGSGGRGGGEGGGVSLVGGGGRECEIGRKGFVRFEHGREL
jgi:hypothetical protein